jgi:PAS domain S-box-containing protein
MNHFKKLLVGLGLVLLYLILARGGLLLAVIQENVAPAWPPSALGIALLFLWGLEWWPVLMGGAFLTVLSTSVGLQEEGVMMAATIASGNTLEALLGVLILKRAEFNAQLDRLKDVGTLLVAATISPVLSSCMGVTALLLSETLPSGEVLAAWRTWWVGNTMGILIFSPLFFAWHRLPRWSFEQLHEFILLILSTVVATYLVMLSELIPGNLPLGFTVFPLVVVAAFQRGLHGVTTVVALISVIMMVGVAQNSGPFHSLPFDIKMAFLVAFQSTTAISGLVISAVLARQRRAEEELGASKERFKVLVEQAFDGVLIYDRDGWIMDANAVACTNLGYSQEELIRMHALELEAAEPGGVLSDWQAQWEALSPGQAISVEGQLKRKNGGLLAVESRLGIVEVAGQRLYVAVVRDITERKKAESERQSLANQLRQAQKMEAVGTLAGGVAHDFNNLLTTIVGNIELATMGLPPKDPARESLQSASEAAQLAAQLVSQLLAFSRYKPGTSASQPTLVNEGVERALNLLKPVLSGNIRLETALQPDAGMIALSVDRFLQILINLALNAYDAMGGKKGSGNIKISTEQLEWNEEQTAIAVFRTDPPYPGHFCKVMVADTGSGMEPEVLEHIFEPFFTTKEVGKGTGLGLAVVYGLVKEAAGWMEVSSRPGQGTMFSVFLPYYQGNQPSASIRLKTPTPGSEPVLVVDDNDGGRQVAMRALEQHGYRVSSAGDGKEALEFLEKNPGIRLVVLDLTMPRLSGRETLARIRSRWPELKVLIASGYSVDGGEPEVLSWGAQGFLQKPYRPGQLLNLVREILDR